MTLTKDQILQLTNVLISKGYNPIDAKNAATGPRATDLFAEYLGDHALEDFFNKWNGRYWDYDHQYPNQCVDLVRQYIWEVLKWDPYVAMPGAATAAQIFDNFQTNKYFTKIINDPKDENQLPEPGDILFWKKNIFLVTGSGGHTAVDFVKAKKVVISIDQNWPTGSKIHQQEHTWRGISGWLHPKK